MNERDETGGGKAYTEVLNMNVQPNVASAMRRGLHEEMMVEQS